MPVNRDRLWADLMALAEITDPDQPWTRRSFSPRFDEGRGWLRGRFAEAGLAVSIDAAGNLVGRREGGPGARTIACGSHSDSVPGGGRFDGPAGLLTALEIARALDEDGLELRHAYEVIDFLAEEPSAFGASCIGSRGLAGRLDPAALDRRDPAGERLGDAMRRVGADPSALGCPLRRDIACFFELHIEQGLVLERSRTAVAVVSGILGVRRVEIGFSGSADHAGTTPFALRRDALLAAAPLVETVRREAVALAETAPGFVATIGVFENHPQGANVVPGRTRLVVDLRSPTVEAAEAFTARLEAAARDAAARTGTTLDLFGLVSDNRPVACDPGLQQMLRDGAAARGHSTLGLASGAGHDAAFVGDLAPVAMLFVPSRGGRSHCADEWTEPHEIAAGAETIYEAIQRLDAAEPA